MISKNDQSEFWKNMNRIAKKESVIPASPGAYPDPMAAHLKNRERGLKGNDLKMAEAMLINRALYLAIQWEQSVSDSWDRTGPEHGAAKERAAEFRALLNKRGYREPPPLAGLMVSLSEISESLSLPAQPDKQRKQP